jgi:hypothetical protein
MAISATLAERASAIRQSLINKTQGHKGLDLYLSRPNNYTARSPKQSAVVDANESEPQINRENLSRTTDSTLAPIISVSKAPPEKRDQIPAKLNDIERSHISTTANADSKTCVEGGFFFKKITDVPHTGYAYLLKIGSKSEVVRFLEGEYKIFDARNKDYKPFNVR